MDAPSPPVAVPPSLDVVSEAATRNLAIAMQLRQTAWELSAAGIRLAHPERSEGAVQDEVRALFRRTTG